MFARFRPDNFTLLIVATVALASVLPAQGAAANMVGDLAILAIGLLFFLQGARLSRQAVVAGMTHWRLHALIMAFTFVLFPLLGARRYGARADPPEPVPAMAAAARKQSALSRR